MSDIQNETPTLDRDSVKGIASFIAHTSVGWTIGNVIGNNTNPSKRRHHVYIRVAAVVLTGVVSGPVEEYVAEKVNDAADRFAKFRGRLNQDADTTSPDSE